MKRWQIVALVIVVVLGLSGMGVARFLMPYELEDEIKLARAQGVPTTVAECYPVIPPDQDAVPDYERAEGLVKGFWTPDLDKARESLSAPGGPSHAQVVKLKAAFDKDNGYLAAIHAAAAKRGCAFHAVKGENGVMLFPKMINYSDALKTLCDEANLQMWEGKPVDAAMTLRLGLNVANHPHALNAFIGAMDGDGMNSIVDDRYRKLLLKDGANAEVDRVVRDSLRSSLAACDISHTLSGEVALEDWAFRSGYWSPRQPFYKSVYYKAQVAAAIHWRRKEIIASRVPPERQRAAIQGVMDEFGRESRGNPVIKAGGEFLPFTLRTMDILDNEAARRRTVYAAACVLEYKVRTGTYPASLSQAVQPVPINPFSHAPLVYKRTSTGFALISAEASRRWAIKSSPRSRNDTEFAYPGPVVPSYH